MRVLARLLPRGKETFPAGMSAEGRQCQGTAELSRRGCAEPCQCGGKGERGGAAASA